jgi:hypothetical protein
LPHRCVCSPPCSVLRYSYPVDTSCCGGPQLAKATGEEAWRSSFNRPCCSCMSFRLFFALLRSDRNCSCASQPEAWLEEMCRSPFDRLCCSGMLLRLISAVRSDPSCAAQKRAVVVLRSLRSISEEACEMSFTSPVALACCCACSPPRFESRCSDKCCAGASEPETCLEKVCRSSIDRFCSIPCCCATSPPCFGLRCLHKSCYGDTKLGRSLGVVQALVQSILIPCMLFRLFPALLSTALLIYELLR